MSPERWRQIQDLYHAALEREPGVRQAFLENVCRDDEDLHREVESLLAQDRTGALNKVPAEVLTRKSASRPAP